MSDDAPTIEIAESALADLPLFPLPETVLLPHTLVSLHIFEPRYRKMIAHCLDTHRVLAIATLDEHGHPDAHGRPPILKTAGLGYIRRSARLPDGRYNLVVEGVGRITIEEELEPETPFRRGRTHLLEDELPEDPKELSMARLAVSSLATRVLAGSEHAELIENLPSLPPGELADTVAAAVLEEARDRQGILEEAQLARRLDQLSGALGAALLERTPDESDDEPGVLGWGVIPGKA